MKSRKSCLVACVPLLLLLCGSLPASEQDEGDDPLTLYQTKYPLQRDSSDSRPVQRIVIRLEEGRNLVDIFLAARKNLSIQQWCLDSEPPSPPCIVADVASRDGSGSLIDRCRGLAPVAHAEAAGDGADTAAMGECGWRGAGDCSPYELLALHVRPGKTIAEVEHLLGKERSTGDRWHFSIRIHPERLHTNLFTLTIQFVEGRVEKRDFEIHPPMFWINLVPGPHAGRVETRWIAPFALASERTVSGRSVSTLSWFNEKGEVVRELTDPRLHMGSEFISRIEPEGCRYYGLEGTWSLVLPEKTGPAGYVDAAGETFVHQYHPAEGRIAVDVYRSGRLAGTAGPFVQCRTHGVKLSPDGSSALLVMNERPGRTTVDLVVVGADGKVRFQTVCRDRVDGIFPVNDGRSVLVRLEQQGGTFKYFRPDLGWKSLEIGEGYPMLASTLPDPETVLFYSSKKEMSIKLVDLADGDVLWDIPHPGNDEYMVKRMPEAAVFNEWILLSFIVRPHTDIWHGVTRIVAAVEIATGKVAARWRSSLLSTRYTEPGRFFVRDGRLFLVYHDEFAEIRREDILKERFGWKRSW